MTTRWSSSLASVVERRDRRGRAIGAHREMIHRSETLPPYTQNATDADLEAHLVCKMAGWSIAIPTMRCVDGVVRQRAIKSEELPVAFPGIVYLRARGVLPDDIYRAAALDLILGKSEFRYAVDLSHPTRRHLLSRCAKSGLVGGNDLVRYFKSMPIPPIVRGELGTLVSALRRELAFKRFGDEVGVRRAELIRDRATRLLAMTTFPDAM